MIKQIWNSIWKKRYLEIDLEKTIFGNRFRKNVFGNQFGKNDFWKSIWKKRFLEIDLEKTIFGNRFDFSPTFFREATLYPKVLVRVSKKCVEHLWCESVVLHTSRMSGLTLNKPVGKGQESDRNIPVCVAGESSRAGEFDWVQNFKWQWSHH